MAITKIHPIKSTLKAAIDYIINPNKTDNYLLVSSYLCQPETADLEFAFTRKLARDGATNLGRHLIQSFSPGEVSEEEAHLIGKKLADKILKNEYEYVIATHNDKGHIHNHIIFNSVNSITHKRYRSNKRSYHEIRRISDSICKEHGLSIIEPNNNIGKSYYEHQITKEGKSYKQQLRKTIDALLPYSKDIDDLLLKLENNGYEIKHGKYISVKAPLQQRYTRLKTLGEAYSEKSLIDRLQGKSIIGSMIDIENNEKVKSSKGYEHWATIHNLKEAAKTVNYLTDNKLSLADITNKYNESLDKQLSIGHEMVQIENKMKDITELIKLTKQYKKLKPVYNEYKASKDKEKYLRGHESEIVLFEATAKQLKDRNITKLPSITRLQYQYEEYQSKHQSLSQDYKQSKQESKHYEKLKKNIELTIGKDKNRSHQKSHEI